MIRRTVLAALLVALAAACGPTPADPSLAHPAAAQRDGDPPPPPPDSTQFSSDTTTRSGGGGTLGSGT
jgi:hypothetical protein